MKEKLLISACLLGENVKYNGGNNLKAYQKLTEDYILVPFCPEVAGGLPTPRLASEILSINPLKIINTNHEDVTQAFVSGADKALELCKKEGIKKALLKANSPSCSSKYIYDGSFSNKLIKGDGVSTKVLKEAGIEVFDEDICK